MAATTRVESNGKGWLFVSISVDDDRLRQKLIDRLKRAFSPSKHGLHYNRSCKAWGIVHRSHALLWTWCNEQVRVAATAVLWEAVDTPEYEIAQQARGNNHQQRRAMPPTAVQAAYDLFHLKPSAPLWVAEAVYKAAIKRYHPDSGGDARKMAAFNTAMERIRLRVTE